MINFKPFVWASNAPADIPFEKSIEFKGIKFMGRCSNYHVADTWYPSWSSDDKLYSPWTDGETNGVKSCSSGYTWNGEMNEDGNVQRRATTGHAMISGNDPLNLAIEALGVYCDDPYPYGGRYPCGGLCYNGVWYYGTYTLSPFAQTKYGEFTYNWPWLGPLVGFRVSTDNGKSWLDTPHTPESPLFKECGLTGYPVKIGAPHFVDFGKNMEHSPDGKAYLVAQGSDFKYYPTRFANLSWITADQVYLIRVTPSIENMNNMNAYEYFSGYDIKGSPIWTNEFDSIKPLLEWQNNMGCVTVTYNHPLQKYLMCVTDGGTTCGKMNSYILESDQITGPWRLVSYLKDFGEQAYFLNLPSKFISSDGRKLWLCYSGNYAKDWNGMKIEENPPGSHYGLVLQEIELCR